MKVKHFVKKPEVRKFLIQGMNIELEVNEHIFPPSPHGSFFAQNFKVGTGESVIDIGTGSGFLAIIACKLGGHVFATDTDEDAIELARENALRNKARIEFHQGAYFAGFDRKFDVILANLPQEIVHNSYRKAIGKKLTKTIDGGVNGNDVILDFLTIAKKHMHQKSRLYIIVATVTDYVQTLQKISRHYNARLVAFSTAPTKEFVGENEKWYENLNKKGKIRIFKNGTQWMANEYLFELTKDKNDY